MTPGEFMSGGQFEVRQKLKMKTLAGSYHVDAEPAGVFKFSFTHDFSPRAVDFCVSMRRKYGKNGFDFRTGKWRFTETEAVFDILDAFPQTAVAASMQPVMEKFELRQKQRDQAEKEITAIQDAVDWEFKAPGLKGTLYPYQKTAAAFLEASNGRAILALCPGAGKSLVSLAYLLKSESFPVLVVCPASVKSSWELEVKKWTKKKPVVVDSRTKIDAALLETADVIIINYDILSKKLVQLSKLRFKAIVYDESHLIKTLSAKRTRAAMMLSTVCDKILMLSGTPVLNRPAELYVPLHILDAKEWPSYIKFTRRYADGHEGPFGWDARGATNLEELRKKTKKYMFLRTKGEILPDLPPKVRVNVPVELEPTYAALYTKAEKSFRAYLKEARKKNAERILGNSMTEMLVKLSELRQITTNGKLEAAKELVDGLVEAGHKVIVFSVYNAPLEALHSAYGTSSVMLTGKTPVKERGDIIKKFQENENVRVFLGGTKSAGAGITLTAASATVFIDIDFTPATMVQAENRNHRPGVKHESLLIYNIYAKDTIDDRLLLMLEAKQKVIESVLGADDGKDTIKALVQSYYDGLT